MNFPIRGRMDSYCDFILEQTLSSHDSEVTLPCLYTIKVERIPKEPYSWGQSRGYDYEVFATLVGGSLGNLYLDRKQLEVAFGIDRIKEVEQDAAESYRESEL